MGDSADFKTSLIRDDRLNTKSEINFGVLKGGQNITQSIFPATASNAQNHVYNIQTPSIESILDRNIVWQSTVQLEITGTVPNGERLLEYGLYDSLAPFPLHQCVNTMTCSINAQNFSINMQDVLLPLIRCIDKREIQRYNGYTPTMFDTLYDYADGVSTNMNVLAGYNGSTLDNVLAPRGAWNLESILPDNNINATGAPLVKTVVVTFKVSENLMISPFLYGHPYANNQGMYGISNMSFQMNMVGASNLRCWRSARNYITGFRLLGFSDSQLAMTFLTPQPTEEHGNRNCVSYYELPVYKTNVGIANPQSSYKIQASAIQINQIPDRIIFFARKVIGTQTYRDSDSFQTITGLSINFNNASGLMSTTTPQELWKMSVENGNSQSFLEWSGKANKYLSTGTNSTIPMSGSLGILEFGKDIQLPDWLAPGSLGNFQLSLNLNMYNQSTTLFNTNDLEFVIICMNSGVLALERGLCSTYNGLLTRTEVLVTSKQEPYFKSDISRMIGGSGFLDSLKSIVGKVAPMAKAALQTSSDPTAQIAAQALKSLGYGKSKLSGRTM